MVRISFASAGSLTTVLAKSGHAALPQHLATVIQFQSKPLAGLILGGKILKFFWGMPPDPFSKSILFILSSLGQHSAKFTTSYL